MNANPSLLQRKYTRITTLIASRLHISLAEALNQFMLSKTYDLIRKGVADMHCLSDAYLAEEIILENSSQNIQNIPLTLSLHEEESH